MGGPLCRAVFTTIANEPRMGICNVLEQKLNLVACNLVASLKAHSRSRKEQQGEESRKYLRQWELLELRCSEACNVLNWFAQSDATFFIKGYFAGIALVGLEESVLFCRKFMAKHV